MRTKERKKDNMMPPEYVKLYQKICTEINNWPAWKKKAYNEEFAKSTHAEKLEILDYEK